ncbi:MAG: hypothetical protein NCW75_10930 [Phycisphaera sp.]|nr:MAG: hypothetical protein NCW75_10930 [Phycisphaera sp.]
MRSRPRILSIRLIAVALVLGVVLAVASVPVAAVAARLPRAIGINGAWDKGARFYDETSGVRYQRQDGPLATIWEAKRRAPFGNYQLRAYASRPAMQQVTADPRPRYAQLELVGGEGEAAVYAVGWPMRTAYATTTDGSHPANRGTPLWEPRAFGETWPVPYGVWWPGLVMNSAFYAALTLGMMVLLRWMRLCWRMMRGRCVACGYELGAGIHTCPECGLAAERVS